MRLFRKAAVWMLCICTALCCCACGKKEEVSPADHLFRYAISTEPASLDPQASSGEAAWTVIQNLYEGLCRLDADGNAAPGAAASWTSNGDYTEFTFTLRSGAVWSDGTALTAADFVYAVLRALNPQTSCAMAEELFCIAGAADYYNGAAGAETVGVTALGADTVRFTLNVSRPDFPEQTARSAYMPCNEAFFLSTGGKYGMEPEALLTNGPFRLRAKSGWVHGEYLRLLRNEHYAGETAVLPSGLQFIIGESDNAVDAILAGDAHIARLPSEQTDAANQAGLQTVSFAETTWGLAFNCADSCLVNTSVRLALVSALSRAELPAYYPLQAAATVNLIPDAITCLGKNYRRQAQTCTLPAPEQSPADLLAQGLTELGRGKLPAITVLCVDTPQNRLLVNQLLTDWRSALGYYFNIEPVADEAELAKRIAKGNYQLALTGVHADENSPASFLHGVAQLTGFASADYDALAAQLDETPVAAAHGMEQLLIGSGVFYPLYSMSSSYALGATVTGVLIRPFGGGVDFRTAGRTA